MSTVVKDLGAVSAYAYAVEKGYTGTEAEFAELMADYAEVGQRADDAADSALESKTAAQTAATTATNKASEAATAATTATNKAAEAQADADAAALDASQALSAASTATTKATEATTAAATAVSAKDDAVAANTAAQSAKTAAQTAQTGAETAAASVQSSAAQIATNASDISQLKSETADIIPVSSLKYSFSKSGSSWNVSIPKNLMALNPHTREPYAWVTLSAAKTIEVKSAEALYYDWNSNDFISSRPENIDTTKPYTIVLYNSYGYLQGRWAEYYKDDYNKATITAKSRLLFPISSLAINFRRNVDDSFSVSVPNSIGIINSVENTYTTKNFAGIYVVPVQSYLVYNSSADALQVVQDTNLTESENITVLLLNSYGVLQGQWAIYANNQNFESLNGTVKMVAHQGSGLLESDGIGHSKLSAYLTAWNAGFDLGECDIKFTSDGVPVCCHDDTFTSGSTVVTIATTTLEQLKTYDYYGGVIATLEEVVVLCKTLGMDLEIDQLAYDMTDAQWDSVFGIIKKYRMFDHVIFAGSQVTISKIQSFYANARIMLLATSSAELTSQLALAESIVTDKNEVIVAFNYGIVTAENVPTYTQNIDPRVKLGVWVIDYASVALQYIPYVDYLTSNKLSYRMIASSIK